MRSTIAIETPIQGTGRRSSTRTQKREENLGKLSCPGLLAPLLLAVCFDVGFGGFVGVMLGVDMVAVRQVCMVSGFFMIARFMVLGRFLVMMLGVSVVLRSFVVVFGSLLRHGCDSIVYGVAGMATPSWAKPS